MAKARGRLYDILLAGIGIGGRGNTTLATVDLLRRARVTFSLSVHNNWLRRVCGRLVELDDMYFTGEEDDRVYRRLANIVLQEARRGPRVALVDDGHPLFYDDVCHNILRRGRRMGLKVVVQAAVSSLDMMIAECGVNIGSSGTQIVEATTLVAARQRLNPLFDTLVLQLGWFGTSLLERIEGHRPERFRALEDYLLRFYPPAHRVRILRSRLCDKEVSTIINCRLDTLSSQYRRIEIDSTLHVPSAGSEKDWDSKFIKQTTARRYLERIARLES